MECINRCVKASLPSSANLSSRPLATANLLGRSHCQTNPTRLQKHIRSAAAIQCLNQLIFYRLQDDSRVDAQVKIDISPIGIDIGEGWLAAYAVPRCRA